MNTSSEKSTKNIKLSNGLKAGVAGLIVGLTLASAQPSFALTVAGPIDQLKLESAKVAGVFDLVVPTAVASTVFAIGAALLKRVAFS